MFRNCLLIRKKAHWNETDMVAAIQAVKIAQMTVHRVTAHSPVLKEMLQSRCDGA